MQRVDIVPAILSKTRTDLLSKINSVLPHVKIIQLDIMDGIFVPNKTVGIDDLSDLPPATYEFHWMVKDPINWIKHFPGPHFHLIHVETLDQESFEEISKLVKKLGGKLGLAINPPTPLSKLTPYLHHVSEVLVMSVNPGFSGQSYISKMNERIQDLRKSFPKLDIEVDGGVNLNTINSAYKSGANILAAASAIFNEPDTKIAIENLKKKAVYG